MILTPIVVSLVYGLIATPVNEIATPESHIEQTRIVEESKQEVVEEYIVKVQEEQQEKKRIEEERRRIEYEKRNRTVSFTGYYVHDGTGSGSCTGSGLCTNNFQVNENGWYTYQGKVVIATATNLCLNLTTGVCGQYNSLPAGYNAYDYGDTIWFTLDGKRYEGIVLDTCGASFWQEKYQRYDIFVAGSQYGIGKKLGTLHK